MAVGEGLKTEGNGFDKQTQMGTVFVESGTIKTLTERERREIKRVLPVVVLSVWQCCCQSTFTFPFPQFSFQGLHSPLLSLSVPPSLLPGPIKVKFLPSSQGAHLHPAGKQPVRACSKDLLIQSHCSSVRPYRHGHRHLWEPHLRAS